MEAIYNQNGFVLESLTKTDFDNQGIAKGVSVKVAHKIGDADEFKHDTGVVYTDSPFILSIFTKNSDYDTISQIAKDVYEGSKMREQDFLNHFSQEGIFQKHTKVVLALSGGAILCFYLGIIYLSKRVRN